MIQRQFRHGHNTNVSGKIICRKIMQGSSDQGQQFVFVFRDTEASVELFSNMIENALFADRIRSNQKQNPGGRWIRERRGRGGRGGGRGRGKRNASETRVV